MTVTTVYIKRLTRESGWYWVGDEGYPLAPMSDAPPPTTRGAQYFEFKSYGPR